MEVIAKTNTGFLIQATELEIIEIVSAVTGNRPKNIEVGQKMPAIDYAQTILDIKTLKNNYDYKELLDRHRRFSSKINDLMDAVNNASNI